ncbi:MAG TPA: hypothetical protein VHW01_02280, partial [Polyangiaceae bacterium]|nr:hypothetical protein [Polyangiaceae bacterium]
MSRLLSIACDRGSSAEELLHRQLASSHAQRLAPRVESFDFEAELHNELLMRRIERELVETERAAVSQAIRALPTHPDAFVAWFESLETTGPGQHDALFPWLAEHANRQQMCWFLRQELAGEAGFDDLVALAQVKLPPRPKLEM